MTEPLDQHQGIPLTPERTASIRRILDIPAKGGTLHILDVPSWLTVHTETLPQQNNPAAAKTDLDTHAKLMGNLAEYFRTQSPTPEQITGWQKTYEQALTEIAPSVNYTQAVSLVPCREITQVPLDKPKSMTVDELADTIRVLDAAKMGTNVQTGLTQTTKDMGYFLSIQPKIEGNI